MYSLDGKSQSVFAPITRYQCQQVEWWTKQQGYQLVEVQLKSKPHPTLAIITGADQKG